jgi:uncharacterized glyoxalase superfamily protein PhnB
MKKLTPVLYVSEIEPCLSFWTRLGFERTAEVPEGDRLGFVILASGEVEVMYQSRTSVLGDLPSLADMLVSSVLYIQVDDLDEVARRMAQAPAIPVVVARRRTFYGAEEMGYREPGGSAVIFSRHTES